MIQPIGLSFFPATTFSPRFTDWLAVGWEIPRRLDSSKVLIPSSRAAQYQSNQRASTVSGYLPGPVT
jgi:hypothetical protein